MNLSRMRALSARLSSTTDGVRTERTTSLPRGSVLHRCSPGNAPLSDQQLGRATAKPLKPGLVSIAGDLHLHIDAINVHLSGSNLPPAGQQEVAPVLRSAVPDTTTAAVTAAQSPAPTPAPFSCIGTMDLSQQGVLNLAMCSDGHSFICVQEGDPNCPNDEVVLRDVRNPAQGVAPVLSNSGPIASVAVSEDRRRIVAACENGLWLWDTWQGRVVKLPLTHADVRKGDGGSENAGWKTVAVTPDGRYAVAGGNKKVVQVWDLQTETCIANADTGGIATTKVAIAPDGHTATALVYVSDDNAESTEITGVSLWKWSAEHGCSPLVHLPDWVYCTHPAVSADGSVVLTDDWRQGKVFRWNGQSGEPTVVFREATDVHTGSLALSADGRRALLGDERGSLSVWDVKGDACLATLRHGDEEVTCMAMSADGRHAVSHSYDGRTCVWHLG